MTTCKDTRAIAQSEQSEQSLQIDTGQESSDAGRYAKDADMRSAVCSPGRSPISSTTTDDSSWRQPIAVDESAHARVVDRQLGLDRVLGRSVIGAKLQQVGGRVRRGRRSERGVVAIMAQTRTSVATRGGVNVGSRAMNELMYVVEEFSW